MAGFFNNNMKIAIFIDGSNLYSKLKGLRIKSTSNFNYLGFVKSLAKGEDVTYIGYYVGQVHIERNNQISETLYSNQQKFFHHLETQIPEVEIVRGHIQNYNGIYKEKGVDVRLALDIYKFANQNFYDRAIVVSSDSDLLPAIRMAQTGGKEIEYIGFTNSSSIAMFRECKYKRLLSYEDLKLFEK
jgi:uncharacterized LabA/DUF88 family protein